MYEGWRFERWATPVSDVDALALVSLVDDGQLALTLEATRTPGRPRWRFVFGSAPIYQNILEEYRLELWERVHTSGNPYGWTVIVPDSPWFASLKEHETLIELNHPQIVHFQIGTEDDVVDVLSPEPPLIEQVKPAPADTPVPGKSRILYHPADRAEIDALVDRVRKGK